jgi:hypothetical protein
MINNAREYCKNNAREYSKNINGGDDRYNAFIFSEVLSVLLRKNKEDILLDIIHHKGGHHNVN